MSTSVRIAPVIGLPQYRGWSQVATNASKNFVCVFAVEGENANNVGRDLAEKILDLQPQSSSELHQSLLDILSHARKTDHALFFSCGLFLEGKSVFATHSGSILLKRASQIGQVLTSGSDLKIIEGRSQPDDLYVLTTHQAAHFLSEIRQKLTQGFDIDTIITSVVPGIHGQDNSSLSALSFVQLTTSAGKGSFISTDAANDEEGSPSPALAQEIKTHMSSHPVEAQAEKVLRLHQPNIFIRLLKKILLLFLELLKKIRLLKNLPHSIKKLLPSKNVYVGAGKNKKRIRLFLFLVFLVGLVTVGAIWRQRSIDQEIAHAQTQINPILARIENAKQLVQSDPIQSREVAQQAIQDLKNVAKEFQDQKNASELIAAEIQSAETFSQNISGLDRLSELPLFFDLRLVESNFVAQSIDASSTHAYFLDTEKRQVIQLNLEKKQSQILPIGEYTQLTDLSIGEKKLYLLGGGIHALPLAENSNSQTLKEEGESDKDGVLIRNFGSYLYVLNPEKRNIYRYLENSDNELSEPIGWLTDKKDLDFTSLKSMAVDGDIWLTTKDGFIKKYTRGEPVAFTLQDLPEPISSSLIVYTKENLTNLYLLEPEKSRLLIFTKEGQFLREIKSESLASATALFANETLQKAFAISGSIIFEIDL